MAAYTVLATRYRPRVFRDVVGQDETGIVLERAISQGRVAPAYLFSGPRGVGKTSMARILAKSLDCLQGEGAEPCGTCAVCKGIDEGGDCLDVVEIDGASHNKVENVRDLIENLRFRPVEARYRIYIVDEVHMLSTSAFNALLKTLEEPPDHAKFVLCTTEPLKVPETIRSRCQQFDFRRLTAIQIRARLADICEQEAVQVPDEVLAGVARHARGSLRDGLSLLDQLITYGDGQPSFEDLQRLTGWLAPQTLVSIVDASLAGDTAAVLDAADESLGKGARASDLVDQLSEVLEGVLVLAAGGQLHDRTSEEVSALQDLADRTGVDHVVAMLDVLVEATRRLRQRHDPRLVVEMALLTLARLHLLAPVAEALAGRSASPPAPAPAPAPAAKAKAPPAARPRASAPAARGPAKAPSASPAAPTPTPAPAPAPAPAPETKAAPRGSPAPAVAPPDDFAARLIAAVGKSSRSLRMELSKYSEIRLDGDTVVLVPSNAAPGGLFAVDSEEFHSRIREAAAEVSGRRVEVRLEAGGAAKGGGAAAPSGHTVGGGPKGTGTPPAAPTDSAPSTRAPGKGGVDDDIRDAWPGAERVDM